ncbi:hypothetical protein Spb1_03180 [Planctopirus ephydatiae]|uniref:Uncharacterized protein n=1 Tax=Planctopirus ephydatiae TaxID=2528019 RepID=A0A518GIN7_9PLAN|nr:hypothetical protein [Planctopirus ephydatiae]QDV28455.1 hypothetical protein Spb1_03180 [Planctopirus ephydatiae]
MPQTPWKLAPITMFCQARGNELPADFSQSKPTQGFSLAAQFWKTTMKLGVVLGATLLGSFTTLVAQDAPGASWSNYGFGFSGGAAGTTPSYYPQAGVGVSINPPAAYGSTMNGSVVAQPTPTGIAPYNYGAQPIDPSTMASQPYLTGQGTMAGYGANVNLLPYATPYGLAPNSQVQGRLPSPALPGPTYQSGYASGAKYFQPGGYDARIGSPYYYDGNERSTISGDPYVDHFGPGFHRNQVHGHYRFPYYSYRAPWYYPGRAVYNRDTNYAW